MPGTQRSRVRGDRSREHDQKLPVGMQVEKPVEVLARQRRVVGEQLLARQVTRPRASQRSQVRLAGRHGRGGRREFWPGSGQTFGVGPATWGMERANVDEIDDRMGPADVKRRVSSAVGATDLALNYYELAPGDSFGFGYHRHPEQEEVFYVAEGTVTFETEDGDVDVAAGEAVRFAPGEWQLGTNEGDERVVALAMGAPADVNETELLRACPDCDGRTENRIEMIDDRDALVTICTSCGAETGRFE